MIRSKFQGYQVRPEDIPKTTILDFQSLTGGLNLSVAADQIDKTETPNCKNTTFRKAYLGKRTGYSQIGTNLLDGGPALAFCDYVLYDGSSYLVAVNKDYLFYYDSAIDQWVYGQDCTGAVTFTGGVYDLNDMTSGTTFNGAATTTYRVQIDSAGATDTYKWSTDGGATWVATLVAITGSNQNLNNGVTIKFNAITGHTSGDYWTFTATKPTAYFTGTDNELFSLCVIQDKLCIANGIDHCMYWNGGGAPTDLDAANCPPAKYLWAYADRLFAGYTEESGYKPQRVRWSCSGNILDWGSAGSGYTDLIDTEDFITGGIDLGGTMVVFKENNIYAGYKTGLSSPPVKINPWIPGTGCLSNRTICNLGTECYFMGDGPRIYKLNQSGAKLIDEKLVNYSLYNIDPDKPKNCFALDLDKVQEYWLFAPKPGDDWPTQAFAYNYQDNNWTYHSFPNTFYAGGYYSIRTGYTFDNQPVGEMDTDTGYFDERSGVAGQGTELLAGSTNAVWEMDGESLTDNGTAISSFWESGDITDPKNRNISGLRLILEYYADYDLTMYISISVNGGVDYIQNSTLTLTSSYGQVKRAYADFLVTGERIRYKILEFNSGGTYRILKVRPKIIIRGDSFP